MVMIKLPEIMLGIKCFSLSLCYSLNLPQIISRGTPL